MPETAPATELEALAPTWIDTAEGIVRLARQCRLAGHLALDTEADSLHSYFHKVCLIQVTAGAEHFLVDPLALDRQALLPLLEVIADPELRVLMHGADYDLRTLDRDLGARFRGLLDTQVMAQLLGEERTGLAALLEQLGVHLDKRLQRADWGRRPLPEPMRRYAAADTAFLDRLAGLLRQRLKDLGRWSWAVEDSTRLEAVRYSPPEPDPLAFERVKGARKLSDAARDRCFSLYAWRERTAQASDVPPFKILGNRQLLELADQPPASNAELARVRGINPRAVRRLGRQILACLSKPDAAPPRRPRTRHVMPATYNKVRAERMLAARNAAAEELAIDPGVLCPKAVISALATAPAPENLCDLEQNGLTGWRLEVLGHRFLGVC